ncbi:EAL domain-containing protein [Palleronia pelagia]|uniref:EAL domain, c-di-GMP-specific phosphodiesterase class I (Or its enzymatically inactive variant) n=1 Tax=Palleronia pelagia TaxID=387096 RepID=A0A1H8DW83_9RHOB|nr:EAL domain-containing protein [Palleronia pelagia]SEN11480.1 EAL domain, c-di-GMP-specific phosphodiesterase class I (or its enzymatically inactive variant) [Palleronia pelagia]
MMRRTVSFLSLARPLSRCLAVGLCIGLVPGFAMWTTSGFGVWAIVAFSAVAALMGTVCATLIWPLGRPFSHRPTATAPGGPLEPFAKATNTVECAAPGALFLIDHGSARRGRRAPAALDEGTLQRLFGAGATVSTLPGRRHAVALSPGAPTDTAALVHRARQVLAHAPDCPDMRIGVHAPGRPGETKHRDALIGAERALTAAHAAPGGTIRIARGGSEDMAPPELRLAADLDQAFESGQIQPFFQPQVSTDTGLVSGAEALARWRHPDLGTLSPRDFMPTIDAAGQMTRLTDHMVRSVLSHLADWDAAGLDLPVVSINFSQADLSDPELPTRIAWALDAAGLGASRLGIEVLETVVSIDQDDTVPQVLSQLARMGCRIDLDDFGTGQASINAIRRFSARRIKIDRTFIRGLDRDPEQQAMVAAIVTLADQLKLEVMAEGIETAGEHSRVAELGCRHVQGYEIARPMNADALPGWLLRHGHQVLHTPLPASLRQLSAGFGRRPGAARGH